MTPEQAIALRSGLPAFGEGSAPAALLSSYTQFYNLDFPARLPGVEYNLGAVSSSGYQLAVHCWQQPDATSNLLLVHGYFDHTGIFGKLVEWALHRKCNVLIFDLPGHGLSTGEPAAIDAFHQYAQSIEDVLSAVTLPALPLWAMGQSTGGAALIEYARHHQWQFAAAVLLAPLIRPVGWHSINYAHRILKNFKNTVPRVFSNNSSDAEFLSFVKKEPLQYHHTSLQWVSALRAWLEELEFDDLGVGPALVIQGDQDGTVDWRFNLLKLITLFPNSRIECIAGAGHQLANESPALRENYLARVERYLSDCGLPLPSVSG